MKWWDCRELAWTLGVREIQVLHAGSIWSLLQPLFTTALLAVAFSSLLGTEALYILSGLIPWVAVTGVLARAPLAVSGSANLARTVAFPLEALALRSLVVVLPAWGVGLAFLLVYTLWVRGALPWTVFLLPLACGLQAAWMAGLALLLAALGVYWAKLKEITNLGIAAGIYLLPILYSPQAIPAPLRLVVQFNPFSALVWTFQDIAYTGQLAHPGAWLCLAVVSLATLALGIRVFGRLRPGFGDLL